jgi:pre-rRNA-processing protein TSR1
MVATTPHHHRSTTKPNNKPFKSRHSTKSVLKAKNKGTFVLGSPALVEDPSSHLSLGKVDDPAATTRKNHHQQVMSKIERRNKARQLQITKHKNLEHEAQIFKGRNAAPRIVAVVPLCESVDAGAMVKALLRSMDIEMDCPNAGMVTAWYANYLRGFGTAWLIGDI